MALLLNAPLAQLDRAKDWKRLTKKQRLEAHLKRIVEELGGVSFTYAVLDN